SRRGAIEHVERARVVVATHEDEATGMSATQLPGDDVLARHRARGTAGVGERIELDGKPGDARQLRLDPVTRPADAVRAGRVVRARVAGGEAGELRNAARDVARADLRE